MDGRSGRNWSNVLRSWAGDPDPFHREKVFFNPDISRLNESDGGNYREQMDGKELEGKKERYKLILLKSLLHFLGAEVVGENSRGSCTRLERSVKRNWTCNLEFIANQEIRLAEIGG